MKLMLFALVITAPCLLTAQQPQQELKEFKSNEGRFTVQMPGTPVEKILDKQGTAKQYQYIVANDDGAYLVSYQDNPGLQKATKDELAKALEGAQKSAQTAVKGKLIQAKEITLDKEYPGREYEFEAAKIPGGIFRARAYLVNGRLYQLIVAGKKDFATSKEADQFLDSFKLVK